MEMVNVGRGQQLLAQYAVDSRQRGFTLWRRGRRTKAFDDHWRGFAQRRIHRSARQPGDAPDSTLNQSGDAAGFDATAAWRSIHKFGPQRPKRRCYGFINTALYAFSQPGHSQTHHR